MLQATNMFREKGIRAVRMDDISDALHISKRTLYETYDNKKELLSDVMKILSEEKRSKIREIAKNCDNVMDILINFFRVQAEGYANTNPLFFEDMKRYPELLDAMHEQHKLHQSEALMFYKKGVEEGYFIPQVNYELFGIVGHKITRDVYANKEFSKFGIFEIFNTVIYVLLRGVCTTKGIERLDSFVEELGKMK